MELFVALCKALPQLDALRSLELEGLTKAFEKVIDKINTGYTFGTPNDGRIEILQLYTRV